MLIDSKKKLELLKKRAEKEDTMNYNLINFKNNKEILYGDTILLQSYHSQMYIRVNETEIFKDNKVCQIEMSENFDEKCLFTVMPG